MANVYDFKLECVDPSEVESGKYTKGKLYKALVINNTNTELCDDLGNMVILNYIGGL